jgi:hypothetical protein
VSAQLHAAAVLTRLGSSGSPALTVHDGKVPNTTPPPLPPYVLVRFSFQWLGARERPDASDLTLASRAFQVTTRCYSVATTAQGVRALTNRVSVALLDWTPTVLDRSCSPMRHIDDFEVAADEQTGTTYFQLGDDYRFTSYPA